MSEFKGANRVHGIHLEHGYLYIEERTEETEVGPRSWLVLEAILGSKGGRQGTKIEMEEGELYAVKEFIMSLDVHKNTTSIGLGVSSEVGE